MRITQTQLLEWVKDGNKDMLTEYFQNSLQLNNAMVHKFFKMEDDQNRNVIHWAAYLGQHELIQWWCTDYTAIIDLNKPDMHGYSPLDLAAIRGYSADYDADIQDRTIRILATHGAIIQSKPYKPNPLHWAFYYGNRELIKYIISKNFYMQLDQDIDGNYPVDYLFLDNRPKQYQTEYKEIFIDIVANLVATTDKGYQFSDLTKLNKRKTVIHRFQINREDLGSHPKLKIQFQDESPESEPSKNDLPSSKIVPIRSYTSYSQISKNTRLGGFQTPGSHQNLQFQFQQKIQTHKVPSKEALDNEIPLYDSQEEIREPEEEKFPDIKVNPVNQSKLLSEQAPDDQFKVELYPNLNNNANKSKLKPTSAPHKRANGAKKQTIKETENFVIYHHKSSLTRMEIYETKLLFWSARLGYLEFAIYFLRRKCSPFIISHQGYNALHIASFKGKHRILKLILESNYEYFEFQQQLKGTKINKQTLQQHVFDKTSQVNILTEHKPSNALHLAIEQEKYHCMKILIQYQVSVDTANYRCLKPFELTYNERILEFYYQNIKKVDPHCFTELGYQYVIQTKGLSTYEQDIVYIQLQNIVETFKERGWNFEFLILNGPDLNHLEFYAEPSKAKLIKPLYHYYVIRLQPDTIYRLADLYGIECYNFKSKHICKFKYDEHIFFEYPKDLWVQMLILKTLNDEFDVDKFVLEQLIVSHYPLEDINQSEKITQFWIQQQYNCIRDSIRYETQQIALRPLHAIASYYGPVIAWYVALQVQMIGWLIIPSLFGAVLGLYIVIVGDVNSSIVPFYALLMTLWATLFMEKWKNRESELRFSWDMHKYKQNQPQRVMYTGKYIIDSSNNQIGIYDKFTTFKRRLIAELPFILIGIAIIVASFYAFQLWQDLYPSDNLIMPIVVNSINGLSMTVFCDLYKRLCKSLVTWENHKFESEMEYSYILKVFLFEFLISYVSVVYVAIFKNDALKLAISVASIIITRGLISNVQSNVFPWLIYKFLHRRFRQRFNAFKQIHKQRLANDDIPSVLLNICQIPKICYMNYINDTLTQDQQIEFLEQMEEGRVKQPQMILYDEYTSVAIQFGYTTMFAPAFPAAPLFFMLNCYISLKFSIYNYQKIIKREPAQAADSIGIWLQIFAIMNYCATFMNCIVIGTVNQKQISNLIGNTDELSIAILLVIVEHVLLLIKYILDVSIPDCPKWVDRELKRYNYLESIYEKQGIETVVDI